MCQMIQKKMTKSNDPIDYRQIFDYSCFGGLLTGPVLRYWWPALDLKIFKNKNTFLRPVKMMIVDIATFRFGIIAAFIFYVSFTQHKPLGTCLEDLKEVNFSLFEKFSIKLILFLIENMPRVLRVFKSMAFGNVDKFLFVAIAIKGSICEFCCFGLEYLYGLFS